MPTLAEELRAAAKEAREATAAKRASEREAEIQQGAAYVIGQIPDKCREAVKRNADEVLVYTFNEYQTQGYPTRGSLQDVAKLVYEWVMTQPGLTPYITNGPRNFREDAIPSHRFSIGVRW